MASEKIVIPEGFRLIFPAWKSGKDGIRAYPKGHGLRAWPLLVPIGK